MSIPIGKNGFIINKGVVEPYVIVQDDLENTGGYLVFVSDNLGFVNGHDYWVLNGELDQFFRESKWEVKWCEN